MNPVLPITNHSSNPADLPTPSATDAKSSEVFFDFSSGLSMSYTSLLSHSIGYSVRRWVLGISSTPHLLIPVILLLIPFYAGVSLTARHLRQSGWDLEATFLGRSYKWVEKSLLDGAPFQLFLQGASLIVATIGIALGLHFAALVLFTALFAGLAGALLYPSFESKISGYLNT